MPQADLNIVSDASDRPFWRRAWLVVGVVVVVALIVLVLWRGSGLIFTVISGWFVALAMEPAVAKLAKRMPRAAATGVVMISAIVFVIAFTLAFGTIFVDQFVELIEAIPAIANSVLDWWNDLTGSAISTTSLLNDLDISNSDLAGYAESVATGILGLVLNLLSGFFGLFTLGFFAFYISAGMPRLRLWLASRFKPERQVPLLAAWDLTRIKVGGYIAARVVLASINAACSAVFFLLIGLPYWLPLALWTGLVAQFVPTVGTYISIILPVVVGLTSDQPTDGIWVLAYALIYQQIENLTIEPRISARAVNLHPAVSFGSAVLGAQLFGVSGALLGVPMGATVMALQEIYKRRYEVGAATEQQVAALVSSGAEAAEDRGATTDEHEDEETDHSS